MSVDIEFEWAGQEWTGADSEALDAAILAERERKNPKRTGGIKRPSHCHNCARPVHAPGAPSVDGSAEYRARGLCTSCYEKARWKGAFI